MSTSRGKRVRSGDDEERGTCDGAGMPLCDQTRSVTAARVRRAFGERVDTFTAERRRDPDDRLLDAWRCPAKRGS